MVALCRCRAPLTRDLELIERARFAGLPTSVSRTVAALREARLCQE